MKLVIVYGGGATGKTTLAHRLSKDLGFSSFLKDEYKEGEFDRLGHTPSIKEFRRLEKESWQKIYETIDHAKKTDEDLLIEGNFMAPQGKAISKMLTKDVEVVEIYCLTKGMTLFKRFVSRNRTEERHKGHRDHLWYGIVFLEALATGIGLKPYPPFKFPGSRYLQVNTTDFSKVEYNKILKFVKAAR